VTSAPESETGRFSAADRAMDWFYARTRTYFVEALFIVLMVSVLAVVPLLSLTTIPMLDASWDQLVQIVTIQETAVLLSIPGVLFIVRRMSRDVRSWLRGDDDPEVVRAAAHWIVAGPPRMCALMGISLAVCSLPGTIYIGTEAGLSVLGLAAYLLICGVFVIGGTIIGFFFVEEMVRPAIAELVKDHENVIRQGVRGVTLQYKVMVLVPLLILYAGLTMASLNINSLELDERLAVTVAVSFLVSATIAVGTASLFRRALLDRLHDLRSALRRVAGGDYGRRLAAVYGDELDDVALGFNEMAERLAAHDVELRASRARIVAASDEARRDVERDLHDGAQQYLVLLELKLGILTRAVADDDLEAASTLTAEVREDLARALSELRDLAHGIYPAVLESDGLPGALQAAAERSTVPVTVGTDEVVRYTQELEAAIYFCCLEALQNAAKHAGEGAKVSVRLSQADGHVQFEVEDDGRGYDAAAMGPSAGLQNMADRIGALGGALQIESTPGAGTTVRGAVPIEVTR
jgi:signal transduction histidine kinase